jgi:AcrR family transcriptional regulator
MLVRMTSSTSRARRATPLAPDDRRRAIIDVVVPLLIEQGSAVTTKQIAEAAGIAEGTIFRVFPDKAALLHAAAEDTLNPPDGRELLAAALAGAADLRERVVRTTVHLNERTDKVMAVMMALREMWMSADHQTSHSPARPGPPQYVLDSQRALLERLTEVFEPHAGELAVEPRKAALLLRTLVLGARHPGAGHDCDLTVDDIADALLHGIGKETR